ncbi:hypothetical protein BH10CHL1_BH10CHL1_37970 [soil metagenome]
MPKLQRTVLLIDDVQEDRNIIQHALGQDVSVDYQFIEAENGAQALNYLRQQQPDCLLINCQLPDTNGLTLLQTVVQQAAPHIYPVVMLTDASNTEVAVQAMQQGAHDFLSKAAPLTKQIQRAVNNAIEKVALLHQLAEQREWSRLTLASINDGVITTDVAGGITYMNPIAEVLTGWSATEAQGKPLEQVFRLFDETTRQTVATPVTQDLRTQQIAGQTTHTLLAGRDGRELLIDQSAVPLREQSGNPNGRVFTFRDISARKTTEDALRQSQRLTQAIIDVSPTVIYIYDLLKRQNIFVSSPAELALGYTLDELNALKPDLLQSLMHPDDQIALSEHWQQLNSATDGIVLDFEYRMRHKDGAWRWFLTRDTVFQRTPAGTLQQVLGVAVDITERKQAEQALHASGERYRTLFEAMDEGFCIIEMLFDEVNQPIDYRFLEINPAFERFTGLEEAVGKTVRQLVPNLERHWFEIYGNVALTGEPRRFVEGSEAMGRWFDVYAFRFGGSESRRVALLFNNITERKQAEDQLRRQEELLRQIADNVPALIAYMGADERYQFVNATFETWFQRSRQQIVGRTVRELIGEDEHARLNHHREQALAGKAVSYETLFAYPDSVTRTVWGRYKPHFAADGTVLGFYLFVMDISERKRAEEALYESEKRFRAFFELAAVGAAQVDIKTQRFITVNDKLCALTGYTRPELEQLSFVELTHPADRAHDTQMLDQREAGVGEEYRVEKRYLRKDGSVVWIDLAASLVRNAAGQPLYSLAIAVDITERKQAEEALRTSEARLNAILYNMPASVYLLTTDHRYLLVNRIYEQENNISNAEIHGQSVYDRWPVEVAEILTANERQVLISRAPMETEEVVQRDGETCYYTTIKAPLLNEAGEPYAIIGISTNITARKRAEAALVAREAFLRAITDAVPNLIGYIDQTRRYRFVNATYAQWLARPREQIEGSTMQDLLGEHLNLWRSYWQRALAGETVNFEETFTYPDGVTRTVMGTYIPDRGSEGQVLGFYLYINDITARKQAEAAVAARETELRVITDNTPGLISYVDREQHYRFVNAAYEDLYQRPRKQIVGQHLRAVLGETAYPQVLPYITSALHGELVRFEATLPYPSGMRPVWGIYVPNVDDQGVVQGFYALITDISERKRAEEQLHASEERLRLALEGGGLGIWEWHIPTDKFTWTEQEYTLFGVTLDTPLTHEFFASLIHPEDRTKTLAALNEMATQGDDLATEYRIVHPDGQVRWLAERSIAIRDVQGQPARLLGVNFDITERKQAEHALQQFNKQLDQQVKERTAELTKRLHELDQFAYVTSHDLKAPLRAIAHLAHWISDDAGELLPPASRGHLEKVHGRIKRMEKLLDDLLAYSRADRYQYTAEKIDLPLLLDDIIRLVAPPQGFAVNAQTPLPLLITQKVPLETVLRNLINNAIKHHDRSDGQIHVAAHDLGQFLEFSVRDDGPGIAPEFQERIFQLFQTLKPRDQVEGSGMGLAIVKKIIESHHGRISVISTLGQGATFRFTWPKG